MTLGIYALIVCQAPGTHEVSSPGDCKVGQPVLTEGTVRAYRARLVPHLLLLLTLMSFWHFPAQAQFDEQFDAALGRAAPDEPFEVGIGVKVNQIVSVNQKAENYEMVGYLRLQWQDPKLAFDESEYGSAFRMLTRDAFAKLMSDRGVFGSVFSIYNQQGRRHTQNAGVIIFSDGQVAYGETFTAQLQAPEFQFAQYPFDTQRFFIHVEGVSPVKFMRFAALEGFSRLGDALGEEEWIFQNSWTNVTEVEGVTGQPTSRFSFAFEANRHLNYYLLRIFLPLAIIILVSWVTFFLQDFGKRVDIAGANLLIFVAFNFTISNDLPRLGYMTFMDAIMLTTFVFSGLVVVMNVIFKRLEVVGREALARRMDHWTLWIYPATLSGLVIYCWYIFIASSAPL
jgi:hypothetical protein